MNTSSSLHITKLAAAERQVKAAIRMFFAREDSLAVHTVAAAGYQLLADLKAKRGKSEAADTHLTSIFYAVRSFRRGTLPKSMTGNPSVMAQTQRSKTSQLPLAQMERRSTGSRGTKLRTF